MQLFSQPMPFPIQDDIAQDESGLSYVLRMANANHLSFSDVAVGVRADSRNYLTHYAAGQVAFWFGGDAVQVRNAIQETYKLEGATVSSFMGHVFRRPYHVRQHAPQVCPICLCQNGKAFAWWDIALVTVCPEHHIRLMDVCQKCQRRVSWRRRSLLTCLCGEQFEVATALTRKISSEEKWLASHIRNLLCPKSAQRVEIFERNFAFLAGISLDCLLRLIWAFGILPNPGQKFYPGEVSRLIRTDEAASLIERAFARLMGIFQDEDRVDQRRGIQDTALRAMFAESATWNEKNLIWILLQKAARNDSSSHRKNSWRNKRPDQYDLFDSNHG